MTLLIEDWDERPRLAPELDPVEFLQSLMDDHGLNQNELAEIAGVGKSYISEILKSPCTGSTGVQVRTESPTPGGPPNHLYHPYFCDVPDTAGSSLRLYYLLVTLHTYSAAQKWRPQ